MKIVISCFNPFDGKRQDIAFVNWKTRFGKRKEWYVHLTFANGNMTYMSLEDVERMGIVKLNARKIKTI